MAEQWILKSQELWDSGAASNFGIVLTAEGVLIGAIGLIVDRQHARAELGYWVGKPYWGQGYVTEAAQAVLESAEVMLAHRPIVDVADLLIEKKDGKYQFRVKGKALEEEDAIANEMRGGLEVIKSGETLSGATRCASGVGRHGAFAGEPASD